MIGVVTALQRESKALWRCFSSQRVIEKQGYRLWEQDKKLVVLESGMGVDAARTGAELLVHLYPLQSLYAVGFAGGVTTELHTGDIVIGNRIYSPSADTHQVAVFSGSPALEAQVQIVCQQRGLPYHSGAVLTVDRVIGNQEEKRQLLARYPVLALDMESRGAAEVAQRYNLPFLAIRSIFDTIEDELPLPLLRVSNKRGQVQVRVLVQYLSTYPEALPLLCRTAHRWYRAQKRLNDFCQAWLSAVQTPEVKERRL